MKAVNPHEVFQHNPQRPHRSYLKGVVIEPGLALNETAALFFQALDGKRTVSEAADAVAQEYDISPQECLGDCLELARDLEKEEIIVRISCEVV